MNKLAITVIAASLAFATPAFAEEAHHPEKAQGAAAAPAVPVKKMQDNVKKMHAQLERIGKAKNDAERQKLMAEHMQTMQENMMAAKGMMGDGMMGCSMMKDGMGMMPPGQSADAAPTAQRMQQMEKRMDMMQTMMEQMGKPSVK